MLQTDGQTDRQTDRQRNAGCHITCSLGGCKNEPNEDGFHVKSSKTVNSSGFCFVLTVRLAAKWVLANFNG